MQLHDPPNLAAGRPVDWDLRLGSDLKVTAGPNDAGVHRARRPACAAIERGRHRKFDHGNELVEHRTSPGALDVGIEVGEAVFDGKAPLQRIGILLDDHVAVLAHGARARARRDADADGACDRERPQVLRVVGQVAEPLAEQPGRREGAESLGADALRPAATYVPVDAQRQDRFV